MKKKTKVAVWRNNLFLLRQIRLASPGRIPLQLLDVFLKTSTNLIFDIYLLRFIINGLQDGTSLGTIALFMFCVLLFHIVVCIFDNWSLISGFILCCPHPHKMPTYPPYATR